MLQNFLQPGTPLIILLGAVAIALNQYFNGRSSLSKEVISTYEVQVKQFKEQIITFREEMSTLTLKVGEQNGIIKEKDKYIIELKALLQDRNPELIDLIKDLKGFMEKINIQLSAINDRTFRTEHRDNIIDQGHAIVTHTH